MLLNRHLENKKKEEGKLGRLITTKNNTHKREVMKEFLKFSITGIDCGGPIPFTSVFGYEGPKKHFTCDIEGIRFKNLREGQWFNLLRMTKFIYDKDSNIKISDDAIGESFFDFTYEYLWIFKRDTNKASSLIYDRYLAFREKLIQLFVKKYEFRNKGEFLKNDIPMKRTKKRKRKTTNDDDDDGPVRKRRKKKMTQGTLPKDMVESVLRRKKKRKRITSSDEEDEEDLVIITTSPSGKVPRYLSSEKVDACVGKREEYAPGLIETKIYDKGIYKVIPNPLDKSASKGVDESYGKGLFIRYKIVYLPRSFLEDPKNAG